MLSRTLLGEPPVPPGDATIDSRRRTIIGRKENEGVSRAVKQLTLDTLRRWARYLRDDGSPSPTAGAAITFGLAAEYLRQVVDNEWTNQMVFGPHTTVSRENRAGRTFMRADSSEEAERFRNMERSVRMAELLFTLQEVEGIDGKLDALRSGNVEPTYSELEGGEFLLNHGVRFRYVTPSGKKGADYDAEILLDDSTKVNCEMKCKIEGTDVSEGAIRNPLEKARGQLPPHEPGLVFLKIPEAWEREPEAGRILRTTINEFLLKTSRVAAVVLLWETQYLLGPAGALVVYKTRVERGTPAKPVDSAVEGLLTALARDFTVPTVRFSGIAEEALSTND